MNNIARFITIACALLVSSTSAAPNWKSTLKSRLLEYGHRNWIVVADSAYPKQSAPGIETIYTDAGQVDVLKAVLEQVDQAGHVQPVIMLDAELSAVTEEAASGVESYRFALKQLLGTRDIKVMPHEDIIQKLDDGSKLFNVLLLKTNMTIPYTSVFIELDCGYWNAEKEAELRKKLNQ